MINYAPQNQLNLSLFEHPFQQELDRENRWVKLADLVPWDEPANVYSRHLRNDAGRLSVDIRTVIAARFEFTSCQSGTFGAYHRPFTHNIRRWR